MEKVQVVAERVLSDRFRRGTDDVAVRRPGMVRLPRLPDLEACAAASRETLHRAAQPGSLLGVLDALRYSDRAAPRHVHQVAGRNGKMRGETGSLSADGVLEDLNHYLLVLFQQLSDVGREGAKAAFVTRGSGGAIARRACNVRRPPGGDRFRHVRGVQKCRAIEADIDECRLHAGQDAADPSLVDVSHPSAPVGPFHEHFLEHAVLHHRDARLAGRDVDEELDAHVTRTVAPETGEGYRRIRRVVLELADFTAKVAVSGYSGTGTMQCSL